MLALAISFVLSCAMAQLQPAGSKTPSGARPYWVGLSVPDAEASAKWYQEKLHFTIKKTLVLAEHQLRIAFVELNRYTVEFVESKSATSFETVRQRIPELKQHDNLNGIFKIGFLFDDVDALAAELKRGGVKVVSGPSDDRTFGVRQFLVEDNSGNVLQFFARLK